MRARSLLVVAAATLLAATMPTADARADGPAWTPSPAWYKQKRLEREQARDRYLERGTAAGGQPQRAVPLADEHTRLERARKAGAAARLQRENRLLGEQRAMPAARSQTR
jgi:hypothetical protein